MSNLEQPTEAQRAKLQADLQTLDLPLITLSHPRMLFIRASDFHFEQKSVVNAANTPTSDPFLGMELKRNA